MRIGWNESMNESSNSHSVDEAPVFQRDHRRMPALVPSRVRARRLALGLSQDDLAQLAGVSQSKVSRLEGGKLSLNAEEEHRVAKALQTDHATLSAPEGEITVERDEAPLPAAVAAIDPDEVSALEIALGRAFDPERHHPRDLEAVLKIVRGMHFKLRQDYDLVGAGRQWLDGAAALRREGVEVTSTSLLWRTHVERFPRRE